MADHGKVYSYCEHRWANPGSPMHIREVIEGRRFPGGGVGLHALCGRDVAWDLSPINVTKLQTDMHRQHDSFRICVGCSDAVLGLGTPPAALPGTDKEPT